MVIVPKQYARVRGYSDHWRAPSPRVRMRLPASTTCSRSACEFKYEHMALTPDRTSILILPTHWTGYRAARCSATGALDAGGFRECGRCHRTLLFRIVCAGHRGPFVGCFCGPAVQWCGFVPLPGIQRQMVERTRG